MLLEIGIGDSYGRPFEFAPKEFIAANNDLEHYYFDYKDKEENAEIGKYTDDCQMSLGVAETLLMKQELTLANEPITPKPIPAMQDYVFNFVNAYRRDPRNGYSKRVKNALEKASEAFSPDHIHYMFSKYINATGGPGNGSVMRTLPIGLIPDIKQIIHHASIHTLATHGSLKAITATICTALTAHYYYYQIKENYNKWMADIVGEGILSDLRKSWDGKSPVDCEAMMTASACISIIENSKTMSDVLLKSVAVGGDVDSVAAVALGLASLKNMENDLPKALYDNLENGEFGRDYLIAMDKKLQEKFPRV